MPTHTSSTPPASFPPRVVRLREAEKITGYSGMQLWRLERRGLFPRRFKLNPAGGAYGAVGFDYGEILQWLEARRASRDLTAA